MMHENRSLFSLPNIHIKIDAIFTAIHGLQAMIIVDIAKINYKEGDEVIIFNSRK